MSEILWLLAGALPVLGVWAAIEIRRKRKASEWGGGALSSKNVASAIDRSDSEAPPKDDDVIEVWKDGTKWRKADEAAYLDFMRRWATGEYATIVPQSRAEWLRRSQMSVAAKIDISDF